MPTENRSSNTDMISAPRVLAEEICNGLRITQERGVKELRAILAQPAEQHHGEPVAYAVFADNGNIRIWSTNCEAVGIKVMQEEGKHAVPLFTHATPGEVERLRDEIEGIGGLREKLSDMTHARDLCFDDTKKLRAKLAECEALLRDLEGKTILSWPDKRRISAALSASAEPSAPKCGKCAGSALVQYPEHAGAWSDCPECKLSAPVERDERADFEQAYQRAVDLGWSNVKHLARQLWDARAALEHKPAGADDLAAFNAAFQKAMETGWDDPIDLARQLWNARGGLERKPALDTKMIGIVHTPPAEYDEP